LLLSCLSVCLSVCPSVCLSVCLSFRIFIDVSTDCLRGSEEDPKKEKNDDDSNWQNTKKLTADGFKNPNKPQKQTIKAGPKKKKKKKKKIAKVELREVISDRLCWFDGFDAEDDDDDVSLSQNKIKFLMSDRLSSKLFFYQGEKWGKKQKTVPFLCCLFLFFLVYWVCCCKQTIYPCLSWHKVEDNDGEEEENEGKRVSFGLCKQCL
jgi:hypothetical protein